VAHLFAPDDVPEPSSVPGELLRMPSYVGSLSAIDDDAPDGRRTYLEFLMSPGTPREQGFMTTTAGVSTETLRLAIAHTYGAVAMIDDCVGQVLRTLADRGLAPDTVVAFTSDHGEFLGDHGLLHKGRRRIGSCCRSRSWSAVPAFRGIDRRAHQPCRSQGDAARAPRRRRRPGDGVSFAPQLRRADRRPRGGLGRVPPRAIHEQYNQTLITADWRLTIYPRRSDWGELFDRRADPGEHRNLFHDPDTADVRDR